MKRAGIYARFSSDKQNERSIDDQWELGKRKCGEQKFTIVEFFADRAISGAATVNRSDWLRLMKYVEEGRLDVVWVEDVDRAFRDEADYHAARKRLDFHRVEFFTQHGPLSKVEGTIKALQSAMTINNLAEKVWRGQSGNIRMGMSAGNMPYGYARTPTPGVWTINETEADVIRRIFAEYVAFDRPRVIVRGLNRDGIRPPRGAYWRPGSLTGSNKGRNAIVGNEIYCGRLIWNRVCMVKDPDTGKRVSRRNPQSEWQSADLPHLAIVDKATFDSAQEIRAARAKLPPAHRQKPRHMLSGLLRCGGCGGGMTVKDRDNGRVRIMCTRRRDGYDCDNGRSYYLDGIEDQVLAGLRSHLIKPSGIRRFLAAYHAERKRLVGSGANRRVEIDKELADVERRLARAVETTLSSTEPVAALVAALDALQRQKNALEAERAMMQPANVVALHPTAVGRYLASVDALAASLRQGGKATEEITTAIRKLIESVVIIPAPAGTLPAIDVRSKLQSLVGIALPGGKVETPAGYVPSPRLPIFTFRVRAA